MKLSSIFQENHVLAHPQGTSLNALILELLSSMTDQWQQMPVQAMADRVIAREALHPTILGEGVCLAHLRIEGLPKFLAGMALASAPMPHPSNPARKIEVIFILLAPHDQNTMMLQAMAAIARLIGTQSFLHGVHNAKAPGRIIKLIEESGIEIKRNLTAGDIMEPVTHKVTLDTPITEAVNTLTEAHDEGVPVMDEKGHLVGELTTREILLLGMPKYMDLMVNPEMLNAFEPFENYFVMEGKTHVRDICRRDFVTVPPEELVVRVAHMMITANRRRVYVMDDDRVIGVIYRKSIVERVMNH